MNVDTIYAPIGWSLGGRFGNTVITDRTAKTSQLLNSLPRNPFILPSWLPSTARDAPLILGHPGLDGGTSRSRRQRPQRKATEWDPGPAWLDHAARTRQLPSILFSAFMFDAVCVVYFRPILRAPCHYP